MYSQELEKKEQGCSEVFPSFLRKATLMRLGFYNVWLHVAASTVFSGSFSQSEVPEL
jgi:hypothetical protein